jgi:molecular chaperone IbpA
MTATKNLPSLAQRAIQRRFTDLPTFFDNFLTHSVGFDDFFDRAFNMVERQSQVTYPPYNVVKVDDTHYTVELAVAGFKEADLKVEVKDGVLTVAGVQEQTTEDNVGKYTHKGIASRAFTRSWQLPEHAEVTKAALKYGMLTVSLEVNAPPEAEVKRLPITVE